MFSLRNITASHMLHPILGISIKGFAPSTPQSVSPLHTLAVWPPPPDAILRAAIDFRGPLGSTRAPKWWHIHGEDPSATM